MKGVRIREETVVLSASCSFQRGDLSSIAGVIPALFLLLTTAGQSVQSLRLLKETWAHLVWLPRHGSSQNSEYSSDIDACSLLSTKRDTERTIDFL